MVRRHKRRVNKVLNILSSPFEAFAITNLKNIRYLTGFTGSFGIALLTLDKIFLLTDFRYAEQAKRETKAEIIIFKNSWFDTLKNIIYEKKIKKLYFEPSCSYETFKKLSEIKKIHLLPKSYIVENIRAIKEKEEIELIKKAVKIAEKAFFKVKPYIKKGQKEKTLALMLEYEMKKQGTEILPFPVIVASGANSSMPHWRNSNKLLKKGDFVIIDWGAEHKGYFSDMTRTFVIGTATDKQINIYETVNMARQAAINNIKTGIKAEKIDAIARNLIKKSGYGEKFGHATGHGVGMDIHELPKINNKSKDIILPGMVFTIEPGIYIEGFGGVRIEDMVYVKENAIEVLTNIPRELEIL